MLEWTRVNEELQPFERANGAVNDDLVSLAQIEFQGRGSLFPARTSAVRGHP